MEVRRVVEYFKDRKEVSTLYVFGIRKGLINPERELGIGVLVNEEKCGKGECDLLEMGSWDLTDDFPQWAMNVVLLNNAPSFIRYHVVRRGSVVFERPPAFYRLRFAEQSVNDYLDQTSSDMYKQGEIEAFGAELFEVLEG